MIKTKRKWLQKSVCKGIPEH